MLEKRNVVECRRTPPVELDRVDGDWDKEASAGMQLADSMMSTMGYKRVAGPVKKDTKKRD